MASLVPVLGTRGVLPEEDSGCFRDAVSRLLTPSASSVWVPTEGLSDAVSSGRHAKHHISSKVFLQLHNSQHVIVQFEEGGMSSACECRQDQFADLQ